MVRDVKIWCGKWCVEVLVVGVEEKGCEVSCCVEWVSGGWLVGGGGGGLRGCK